MSGKSTLGHYLNEYLPDSVHMSQTDPMVANYTDEKTQPITELLQAVRSQLRCGRKVVFSARLASPEQRRRVLEIAQKAGAPKLLVELEGTDPEALKSLTEFTDTLAEIRALLQRLSELLPTYLSLSKGEERRYSTLTVSAEDPVEDQVKAVLDGWGQLGIAH